MKHYQFLFFGVMLAAVLVLLDIALEHQGGRWTSPDAGTASGLRYGYLAVICLLCVGSGWLGSKLAKREAVQRRKTQEVDAVWNAILERGPIGIAVLSPKMEQLYYNEKALRQLGLTEKIETGTSAFSVSTQWTVFSQEGEQLSSEERPLARLAQGRAVTDEVLRIVHQESQHDAWVRLTAAPIHNSQDELIANVIMLLDPTEEITSKAALQAEETRLTELWNDLVDVVYELDDKAEFTKISPSVHDVFGYHPEEVIGRKISEFYRFPEQRDELEAKMARDGQLRNAETQIRRKDGKFIWVSTNAKVVFDEAGTPVGARGITRDISEKKAAEEELTRLDEQLRHSQRLASLGTLAGGVAHNFNNLLTAILGYAELAKRRLEPTDRAFDNIDKIIQATSRATELVGKILLFSRKRAGRFERLDLSEMFGDTVAMLREATPSAAEIIAEVNLSPAPALGDLGDLEQVIVNIAMNAIQAADDQAVRIEMTLDKTALADSDTYRGHRLPPGEYARICISDNGPGIDVAPLNRIFEPFYTTKDPGMGTGLGLSIATTIIDAHGGSIEAQSEVGAGATFTILLPLAGSPETVYATAENVEPRPGGAERILLVDDEPSVLEVLGLMLESLGYRVETTTDPQLALTWLKERSGKFDLLVTDQGMPHMSGADLVREVRRSGVELPVILCTGLVDTEDLSSESGEIEFRPFLCLQKPLRRDALAAGVRAILEPGAS